MDESDRISSPDSSSSKSERKKQLCYKILVIGDPGTGKSSIIRRYVHNIFTANYKATIGVDFALKILPLDGERLAHLQMWDISGQDRYGVMTRVYYKDAHGAVVVFDATRERTVEGALRWKADLDQKLMLADGSAVPTILVANKCDLSNHLSDSRLSDLEREHGFMRAIRASAKDDFGIEEAFTKLVDAVISTEESGRYDLPLCAQNRAGTVRIGHSEKTKLSEWNCC